MGPSWAEFGCVTDEPLPARPSASPGAATDRAVSAAVCQPHDRRRQQGRVWREYRGLTIKALAEAAGLTPAYLSQIETGVREGTVETYKKIAAALRVKIDSIA
jgi:DNA-binding XRE family transcriptional regulator